MEYHLLILLVCIPNSLQDFYKSNDQPVNLSLTCKEGTVHPVAKNCRKYYKCISGKLKLRTCPGIDEFSPVYKWCLPPNLARCWHPPKPQPTPATCIIPPLTTTTPPAPTNATATKPSTTSVTSTFKISTTAITSLDNATEVSEIPFSEKVTHEIGPSTDELSTRSIISNTPNKQSTYEKSTATVVISSTESSLTNATRIENSSKTVPPPTLTVKTKTPDQWRTTLLPSSPGELPIQKDIETSTASKVTKNKEVYSTPVSTSSDKQFTDVTETTKISSEQISTLVFSKPSMSNNTTPSETTIRTSTIEGSTKTIFPSKSTPSSPGITEVSTAASPTEASNLSTGLSSTQQSYFVTTKATEVTTEEGLTIPSGTPKPSEPNSQTYITTPSIFDKITPTEAVTSKNITSVTFVGNLTSVETTVTIIKETTTESKQWINTKSTEASTETTSWPDTSSKTDVPSETTASSKIFTKESPTEYTETSTELPSSQKPNFVTTDASKVTVEEISTVRSGSPNSKVTAAPKTNEAYTTPLVSSEPYEPLTSTVEVSTETKSVPVSVVPTKTSSTSHSITKVSTKGGSTVTFVSSNPNDTATPSGKYSTSSITTSEESTETKSLPISGSKTGVPSKFTVSSRITKLSTTESSTEPTVTSTELSNTQKPNSVTTEVTKVTSEEISTVISGSSNPNDTPTSSGKYSTPSVIATEESTENIVSTGITKSSIEPTETSTELPSSQKTNSVTTEAPKVTAEEISTITSPYSNESPKTSETYSTPSASDKTKPSEATITSVDTKSTELWPSTVEVSTETKSVSGSSFTTVVPTKTSMASPGNNKVSTKEGSTVTSGSLNPNDTPIPSKKHSTPSIKTTEVSIETTVSTGITKSITEPTETSTELPSSQKPNLVTTDASKVTVEEISTVTSGSPNSNESAKTSETYSTPSASDKTKPSEATITSVDEKSTELWPSTVEVSTETKSVSGSSFTTVVPTKTSMTSPENNKVSTKEGSTVTSGSLNPNDTPIPSRKHSTPSIKTTEVSIETTVSTGITKSTTEPTETSTELPSSQKPNLVTTDASKVTVQEISTVTSGSPNSNESAKTSETYSTPSVSDKTKPSVTTITELWSSTVESSTEMKSVSVTSLKTVVPTETSTALSGITKEGPTITSGSSYPNKLPKTSETYFTPSISDKTTPTEAINAKNFTLVTLIGNLTTVESTKIPDEETTTESLSWISKKTTEQSAKTKSVPIPTIPSSINTTESSTETPKSPTKLSSSRSPYNVTTEATEVPSEGVSTITSESFNPNESPKTSETHFTPSISDKTTPTEAVNAKNITSATLVGTLTTVETTKIPDEETTTESLPWISKKTIEQSAETKSVPISTIPSGTTESLTETTKLPTKLSSSQTPYNVTTEATEVPSEGVSTLTSGSSNPNKSPKTSDIYFTLSILDKTTPTEAVNAKRIPSVTLVGNWTTFKTTKIPDEETTTESLPWINKKTTEPSAVTKSLPISTIPSSINTKENSTETTKSPTKLSSSQTPYNVTTEATEVPSEGVSTITSGSSNPNELPKTSETHFTPSILDKTTPTEAVNAKNITSVTLVGNLTTVETKKTVDKGTTTESIPWISKKTAEESAETKSVPIFTKPSGINTKESSTETTKSPTKLFSSQSPYNVTTEATEVPSEGVSTITSGSSNPNESPITSETELETILEKTTPTEAVNPKNFTLVTLVGNLTTAETTKISEEDITTEPTLWTSKKTTEETATTKSLLVSSFKTNFPSESTPISSGTTNVFTKVSSTEGTQSPTELLSSLKPFNVTTETPEDTSDVSTKSSSCTSKSELSSATTLTTLETSAFTYHRTAKDDKISTESFTGKDSTETKSTPFAITSSTINNVPTKEIPSKVTQSPVTQGIDLSSASSFTHSEETLPSSTQVSSRENISPISENLTTSSMEYINSSIKPELSTNIGDYNITNLEPNSHETLSTAKDSTKQPPTPDSLIKIITSTTVNPTLNTEKTQWPLTSSPSDTMINVTSSSFTTATESSKFTRLIPERSSTSLESVTSTKISTLTSSPDLSTSSESYPSSLITSSEQYVNVSTTKFISSTESSTASSKAVCEESHLYPDPSSCKNYHFCLNGTLKQVACPEYMEFSTLYHSCLPISIAACSVSTSPSTTTTSQPTTVPVEPSCIEGKRYPDPWACKHYYICKNDSLVHETCPLSTLFSYMALSCVPATSVQCLQLSTTSTTEKICIEPGIKTSNKTTSTGPVTDKIQSIETSTNDENSRKTTINANFTNKDITTKETDAVTPKKEAKKKTFKPKAFTIGPHGSILDSYMCTDRFAYPNPNDCSKFYLCEENKLAVKDCPDGEEFSEDEEKCLPADVAGCSYSEEDVSIEIELYDLSSESRDANIDSPRGYSETKNLVPDLADCRYYISCVNNNCVKTKCDNSDEFSPSELKCLPPKQAGCKKSPVFDNIFRDVCPRYQHSLTYHVYPHFCSYYYVCQYGKLYFYACPYGLEFSSSLLTCTLPSEANCKERNRRQSNDKHDFNINFNTDYYKNPTYCKECAEAASDKNGYSYNHNIKYHRNGYEHSRNNSYKKRDENSVRKYATDKNNRTMGNFFSRWLQNRRDFIGKFLL